MSIFELRHPKNSFRQEIVRDYCANTSTKKLQLSSFKKFLNFSPPTKWSLIPIINLRVGMTRWKTVNDLS